MRRRVRSMAYAGQVGERDSETLFDLAGPAAQCIAVVKHRGVDKSRSTTSFKPDGNRLEHVEEIYEPDAGWKEVSKYVYGYTDSGVRSGPQFFARDESGKEVLKFSLAFEYESNLKRRRFQRQYAPDGALMHVQNFAYNARGQRTLIEWKDVDGNRQTKYVYSYSNEWLKDHLNFFYRGLRAEVTPENRSFTHHVFAWGYFELHVRREGLLPSFTFSVKFKRDERRFFSISAHRSISYY